MSDPMTPLTDEQFEEEIARLIENYSRGRKIAPSFADGLRVLLSRARWHRAEVKRLKIELAGMGGVKEERNRCWDMYHSVRADMLGMLTASEAELAKVKAENERLRGALEKIEQRSNEHGSGITWAIDTIHALYSIARAALATKEG